MAYVNLSNDRKVSSLAAYFGENSLKLKPQDGSFGGFASYLARSTAHSEEDVSKDAVVFSSWNKSSAIECIPVNSKEKNFLKNKIIKTLDLDGKYIGVIFEPDVADMSKFSEEIKALPLRDLQRLGIILVDIASADYPSYEPVFAVWHVGQIISKDKERTPHLHVVMQQVKTKRTNKEIEKLER